MSENILKEKSRLRKDKSMEEMEEIENRKKAKMSTGNQFDCSSFFHGQSSFTLGNPASTSAAPSYPVSACPVSIDVNAPSTSGLVANNRPSYNNNIPPSPLSGTGNHFAEADSIDADLLNSRASDIEKACSSEVTDEPIKMQVDKKRNNHKSKVKELQERVASLRLQLDSKLKEVERAKIDRDEVVAFMNESYQNATRDVANSQKKLEHYKRLTAAKLARRENDMLNANKQIVAKACTPGMVKITPREARLIASISVFLSVHDFGAHVDYICSYLENIVSDASARDVEALMRRFPRIFKEETTGIGINIMKIWKYLGLKQ